MSRWVYGRANAGAPGFVPEGVDGYCRLPLTWLFWDPVEPGYSNLGVIADQDDGGIMTAHLPGRIVAPWQESIPATPGLRSPAIATVVMGGLTAAYGLLELLNPAILAKQTGGWAVLSLVAGVIAERTSR